MRINSMGEARLAIFGPSLLGANPRLVAVSTIGALGPGCGVILDGQIAFPFL